MSRIEVLTSGIWQLSSVVVASRGEVAVIDPGYFPRELDALAARAGELGSAHKVIFTHGHWDHVVGWRSFPGAPVIGSPSLASAVSENSARAQKDLAAARDFDGRWYIDRPLAWPAQIAPLAEGSTVQVGDLALEALTLPGHSADGLALRVGDLLIAGDYLSPLEIPFVEDIAGYRATLVRLLALIPQLSEIIPGHGPRLTPAVAARIAEEDLVYLDRLSAAAGDRARALAVALPRAADVPGMNEHHAENVDALGRC